MNDGTFSLSTPRKQHELWEPCDDGYTVTLWGKRSPHSKERTRLSVRTAPRVQIRQGYALTSPELHMVLMRELSVLRKDIERAEAQHDEQEYLDLCD